MKNFLQHFLKLFTWLFESRRPLHIIVGLAIATITSLLGYGMQCPEYATKIMAIWISLVAGVSADYKDYEHGDKFDILDVLSTVLPSIILSFI